MYVLCTTAFYKQVKNVLEIGWNDVEISLLKEQYVGVFPGVIVILQTHDFRMVLKERKNAMYIDQPSCEHIIKWKIKNIYRVEPKVHVGHAISRGNLQL